MGMHSRRSSANKRRNLTHIWIAYPMHPADSNGNDRNAKSEIGHVLVEVMQLGGKTASSRRQDPRAE